MKNYLEKILYSKPAAIVINTIFGICLWYTVVLICFLNYDNNSIRDIIQDIVQIIRDYREGNTLDMMYALGYTLYIIVWVALDIIYNRCRHQKRGGGRFFWLSVILPAAPTGIIFWKCFFIYF